MVLFLLFFMINHAALHVPHHLLLNLVWAVGTESFTKKTEHLLPHHFQFNFQYFRPPQGVPEPAGRQTVLGLSHNLDETATGWSLRGGDAATPRSSQVFSPISKPKN